MNHASMMSFLLWCTIANYVVLLVWFAVYVFAHDAIYRLHSRWFRLSVEQFDVAMYCSMAVYKIGILLLNLAPLFALWMLS
jgi:hypothetical protein